MGASTIDKEFFQFYVRLSKTQKRSMLQMMKDFLNPGEGPAERISIEQYNKELEEAMEEVKRGETYSHEQVIKMAKGW